MSSADRLADRASLRRIEVLAVAWMLAGAVAYGLARSWAGALALTGASAVSIVAFRGLQRIVSALGPAGDGSDGAAEVDRLDPLPMDEPAGTSPAPATTEVEGPPAASGGPGKVGWRPALGAVVRLGLLGAIAGAAAFLVEPEHRSAIVLGFSTLPAAFMSEGALQVARAFRGRDHDDVC